MKKEVKLLKLNTDPDVTDLGIFSYTVVVDSVTSKDFEADAKAMINGLKNEFVLPEHRIEELDDLENIAIREVNDVAEDVEVGLKAYFYRTKVSPNTVFEIKRC